MIVYTVTTPEGRVMDLLGRFEWSKEQFDSEINKGLWSKLSNKEYLDFDEEGKVIIYSIKSERE